jgi:hypothetical protein
VDVVHLHSPHVGEVLDQDVEAYAGRQLGRTAASDKNFTITGLNRLAAAADQWSEN